MFAENSSIYYQSHGSKTVVMNIAGEVILNARIQRTSRPTKERK